MKILLLFIAIALASCSKKRKCYDCTVVTSTGTPYEKVCTKGNPHDELPDQNAGGQIVWDCKER